MKHSFRFYRPGSGRSGPTPEEHRAYLERQAKRERTERETLERMRSRAAQICGSSSFVFHDPL